MTTDLDPIAVLRRTDPADVSPVPDPPALDELAAIPEAVGHRRPARSRVLALAAAVVLVLGLAGAAVLVATDDPTTPIATDPGLPDPGLPDPATDPATDGSSHRYERGPDGRWIRVLEADGEPLPESEAEADPDEPPSSTTTPAPQSERPAMIPLADPVPARDQLLALAERAATDTTPVSPGPVTYQRFVMWQHETFDSPDRPSFAYQSRHRETWVADGVGTSTEGPGPEPRIGEVVQMEPDPAVPPTDTTETITFEDFYLDPADLPDDPPTIDVYLQVEHGAASDFTYPLERGATLLGDRPRTGADRAAVLHRLAEIEQIQYRGEVVDRAGRPSLAFSAQTDSHGGITEVVVLLDPETGAVNGREDLMLEGDSGTVIAEPIVQYFQVWIDRANVGAVGDRPA